MATGTPTISTHVLDVGTGRPAVGVRVRLIRIVAGAEVAVGKEMTDHDGRVADLLDGKALEAGDYRLS
ncbi:MAG: hydroxyisourate hydrolase, partial [Candidatus Limnocylindrales bacterium]